MKLSSRSSAGHSPGLQEANRLEPVAPAELTLILRQTKSSHQPSANAKSPHLAISQSAENSTLTKSFQSSDCANKPHPEPSAQDNVSFQALGGLSNMLTATLPHLQQTDKTEEVCFNDDDSPSTLNHLVKVRLSKLKQPRNNITAATCSTTGEGLEKTDQFDPNNELCEESIRNSGSMVITFGPTTKHSKSESNSKQEVRPFRGLAEGPKEQSKSPEGRGSLGTLASSIHPKFLLTNSSKHLNAPSPALAVPQSDTKLLNRRLDIVEYLPELDAPAEGSRSPRKATDRPQNL